jgi:hypothetical protein
VSKEVSVLDLRATTIQGQETVLTETTVEGFRTGLRGKLIRRGDEDYDERRVFNAMIDRYPALIIGCAGLWLRVAVATTV